MTHQERFKIYEAILWPDKPGAPTWHVAERETRPGAMPHTGWNPVAHAYTEDDASMIADAFRIMASLENAIDDYVEVHGVKSLDELDNSLDEDPAEGVN